MLPKTIGELKESGYKWRPVKDELRENLIARLKNNQPIFQGLHGYDETVIPQVINAILSRHNFILLGLRGQAKSRLLRSLTTLLDEWIPVIEGSEINDNPFNPISAFAKNKIAELADKTPIAWLGRESRFIEKLATPDVTVSDLIGDLDPIRAIRGGRLLSDELNIHFGLLPRANRGIFAINELPDLAGKIQVSLFNIMQEGDIQIKGFPVRMPLDVLLVFSANPEDYTARGKIITPLKDRIGSEIRTHYPKELAISSAITRQEARLDRNDTEIYIPDFISDLIEQIVFEARDDQRIDKNSGVSQRFSITVLETTVSNAEKRAIINNEPSSAARPADVYAALPAMTGKMELEYEGEQIGAIRLAQDLIKKAARITFESYFLGIDFTPVIRWFEDGNKILLADTLPAAECLSKLEEVPELIESATAPLEVDNSNTPLVISACEFVLEGLFAQNKISRTVDGTYEANTQTKRDRRGLIYEDLTDRDEFS
jgi:magnesium chelatase subunit I